MEKCAICHVRTAVIYMTRMDPDGKSTTQGVCIKCARKLGIKPVDDIMSKFGISPDEIDMDGLEDDIEQFAEGMSNDGTADIVPDGEHPENDSRTPSIDPSKLFGKNGAFAAFFNEKANGAPEKTGERKAASEKEAPKFKFLEQFCTNLNDKAKNGKLDRIVGRDRELARIMQILCRRQKNNPCLIGEPGVGKTAVAEALAQRIADGNVPTKLANREIYLVDLTALVAGTQFRGQFEARMQGLLNDVKKKGNVILAIDEVHNIVGAGEAEGSMNAANILKPALSRGEIQVIGATTMTEYRKNIEKDSALERRFQPVLIDEPSVDDTVDIINGIKHYYEEYHGIHISDEVARKAVILSERYITDRFLPDKAIDLIDEAAAHVALNDPLIAKCESLSKQLTEAQNKLEAFETEINEKSEVPAEDYEKLAVMRSDETSIESEYAKACESREAVELTLDDIASVIEIWTGVPASSINESEYKRVNELDKRLKQRLIGQDEAVSAVVRAIKRNRAGVSAKRKPVSFIFAGPTGVGKTELVKTLAADMFDSPESLIRLDMSEFMEKHSVSRIIGAPPGYVGYDDAGQLTEKIRRKPYSVVLFDEIEKAHPDVMNILLQILDDGRVTDAHGKTVNFENTILVMTTNAGSELNNSAAGFMLSEHEITKDKTERALSKFLRPEFLNRVDEIITFRQLSKEDFVKIADIMLNDLKKSLAEKSVSLAWSEDAAKLVAENSYSQKYGARNMRRYIQDNVEDVIADEIISHYDSPITIVSIEVDNGKLKFTYL